MPIPGPPGVDGPLGVDGPTGPTGPQGVVGARGFTGPTGNTGPVGVQGIQGTVGPTGAQGPRGATGPQGIQGPTGPRGATGSVGPAGPQGFQGATGARGPTGFTGPVGATGATGARGPTGPPDPTPVFLSGNQSITGTKFFDGQLRNPEAYNRSITTTPRRNVYSDSVGRIGHLSSSMRFKQNIQDADVAPEKVLGLRVVDFEYKESPDHVETGLIAEEVEETGLEFLIFREPDGSVQGVHYEKVGLAVLSLAKKQKEQVESLTEEIEELEKFLEE